MKNLVALFIAVVSFLGVFAQDDLMDMLEADVEADKGNEKVFATFKTMKVVNAHSTETTKEGALDFRITHRFGNMGQASNGGAHTLYGFDSSEDIRFSFDYGVTKDLQLGVGRSKRFELLDGSVKWRALTQTTNNKVPVTIVGYANIGMTPGIDVDSIYTKSVHRLSYITQLIIARKLGPVSLELLPTYSHRNVVTADVVETSDGGQQKMEDENGIFALGFAGRVKLTSRISIIADYFLLFSDYRTNVYANGEKAFRAPLGVGIELETGGHVFHIDLTNASGIMENNYIPYTNDDWLAGGYKLGFTISRTFQLHK